MSDNSSNTSSVTALTDEQLRALLHELRAQPADAPHVPKAIAELEAEVARRNLKLGEAPHEEMPQQFLLRRFAGAVKRGDVHRIQMAIWDMHPTTVWSAYRILREVEAPQIRRPTLELLFYVLDCRAFGQEAASKRQNFIEWLGLKDDDREAFIRLCIESAFSSILSVVASR